MQLLFIDKSPYFYYQMINTMSDTKGVLLRVTADGELATPAITKENGDVLIQSMSWESAVQFSSTLNEVNKEYAKYLKKTRRCN